MLGAREKPGLREIQVLPDVLVNQIAAGEVVERPASVVKELAENALDAGASHISIEIEGGGKTRIRVLDNGAGMSAQAAELALQRHATSKLRSVDDLFALHTFGFRGEALPSIASVSKMCLTTREREGQDKESTISAHRIQIAGGVIVDRSEVGAPVGTCIEVSELLYNVPARRKFMKGEATETSHITDVVTKIALANPDVHIRLKNGARTTVNAPGHSCFEDRIHAVMGARLGEGARSEHGEYGGVEVRVFLAPPALAQSTTRGLQLFVGRRPIRDRGLLHAIMQGYSDLIPRGRYPVAVVLIDTPRADVDVNVHPQKLEVRFSDPQLVYAAVRQVVRQGVRNAGWEQGGGSRAGEGGQLRVISAKAPPLASSELLVGAPMQASALAQNYAREHAKLMLPWGRGAGRRDPGVAAPSSSLGSAAHAANLGVPGRSAEQDESPPLPAAERGPRAAVAGTPGHPARQEPADGGVTALPNTSADAPADVPAAFFSSLRYIGQLSRTYLLCEAEGELVMLDQHAAHERVELDKLLLRYRERTMPVQTLLFPQTIALSPEQATAAETHGQQLAAMGFELDDFGDCGGTLSYALKTVPSSLQNADSEAVLRALLDELVRTGQGRAIDEIEENLLATVACHSVVRAGDSLSAKEVESLLSAMDKVDFRGAAPHGRPVLLRIGIGEIAKRFGR